MQTLYYRRWILLWGACLGVTIHADDEVQPQGELFKRFISNPPVIRKLVYRRKLPPVLGRPRPLDGSFEYSTNYATFTARWQPGHVLVETVRSETARQYSAAEDGFGYNSTQAWYRVHKQGFCVFRSLFDLRLPQENYVFGVVDDASYDFYEIMNMGVMHAKAASIRWVGNGFDYESPRKKNMRISGTLHLSESRKPDYLKLRYSQNEHVAEYIIRYYYEPSFGLPFLPNRIRSQFLSGDKEIELNDFHIKELIPSEERIPAEEFTPRALNIYPSLKDRYIDAGILWRKAADGSLVKVQNLSSPKLQVYLQNYSIAFKRTVYLVSAVLANATVFALLWRVKERKT